MTTRVYSAGTAAVASDKRTVTLTGGAWTSLNCTASSLIVINGYWNFVNALTDTTHLTLQIDYGGTVPASGLQYAIYPLTANEVSTATANLRLATLLAALAVSPAGIPLIMDGSGITDVDPGSGKVRFNSASAPTIAYINKVDTLGVSIATFLAAIGTVVNASSRGTLQFIPNDGSNAYLSFGVTGAITDAGTYVKVPVTLLAGTVPANLAALAMASVPAGADGAAGTNGTNGTNGANGVLSAVENVQTANYTIVAADKGKTVIANKATAITFTLDAPVNLGAAFMVVIKNIGAGVLSVVNTAGAAFDDTTTSITVAQYSSLVIECNGTITRAMLTGGAAGARTVLQAARTYYVGANLPTPTISIASPAVVSSTAHGLLANDPVVFNVPQNIKSATITEANPGVVTLTQTFATGQPITFSSTGKLPAGVTAGTTYYVIATGLSGSSFQFSATVGGAAVNTTPSAITSISNASPAVVTQTAHGYVAGQPVQFATTGTLPTGLSPATTYYVIASGLAANTYEVSATPGGAAINTSSAGSGSHTSVQNGVHYLSTTGALPTGITEGTTYYVISAGLAANTFEVSTTPGGAAVNTSGSVTGSPVYGAYTGNDANNGLAQTRAGAFLTIQAAIASTAALDLSTFAVTIQVANGTFLAGVSVSAPFLGGTGSSVTLTGNTTTPSNALISTTSAACIAVSNTGSVLNIGGGFKLQTTTSGNGIAAQTGGVININGAMVYGASASGSAAINASYGGQVIVNANYLVTASGYFHVSCIYGLIQCFSRTVTILGLPTFSAMFAYLDRLAFMEIYANTYLGAFLGTRYSASANSVLFTNGGGANYFPGTVAGSTATGAQYT